MALVKNKNEREREIYLIAPFKPMSCILDLRIVSQAYVHMFILVALRLEVTKYGHTPCQQHVVLQHDRNHP